MPRSRTAVPRLAVCLLILGCSSPPAARQPTLVATVDQSGPVGYRDPLGVVDPSGRWLVTAANEVLQVRPLVGNGSPVTLPSGNGRIVHLAWDGQGRLVTDQRGGRPRWWRYDLGARAREPLWPDGARLADGDRSVSPTV